MAYYTPSGLPANQTREISAQIRNEYALLAAGFNMLPLPAFLWGGAANFATDTGAANAYVVTNGSAYVTGYYDGLTLNIRALAANPLVRTIDKAETIYTELAAAHRAHLPERLVPPSVR